MRETQGHGLCCDVCREDRVAAAALQGILSNRGHDYCREYELVQKAVRLAKTLRKELDAK